MPVSGPWETVPGMLERLQVLHADREQYSCAEIANMLSEEFKVRLTRNAIIGKVHRLRLPFRPKPAPAPRKPRKYTPRKNSPRPRAVQRPVRAPRTDGTVTIYQLRSDDCRFPLGEFPFVFCGKEQQEGSSYCPEHFAICHGNVQRKDDSVVQIKALA